MSGITVAVVRRVLAVLLAAVMVLGAAGAAVAGDTSRPRPWFTNPDINERSGSAQGQGEWIGWAKNSPAHPNRYDVHLKEFDSGTHLKVNARGTDADFGNFSGSIAVFRERRPGRPSDLFLVGPGGPYHRPLPPKVNSPVNEFLPTLWGPWLLFTRTSAATDTHRVMLYNRRTTQLRTLATASGRNAVFSGQVRGDYATWFTRGPERSNVFLHQISTGETVMVPRPAEYARQHSSSVGRDGTVYFQRRAGSACGTTAELVMYPLGGPAQVLHTFPDGKAGGRTVVFSRWTLTFDVRKCSAPRSRAWDVFALDLPAATF